jgi:hypothetical protein
MHGLPCVGKIMEKIITQNFVTSLQLGTTFKIYDQSWTLVGLSIDPRDGSFCLLAKAPSGELRTFHTSVGYKPILVSGLC